MRLMWTAVKPVKFSILFFTFMLLSTSRLFAAVPPDFVELTSAEMKNWEFKFKIHRDDVNSSINLYFPKRVLKKKFWLAPHSTEVIVKNSAGEEIARTTNWVVDNEFMSVVTSYKHKVSDLSVTVTYTCPRKGNRGCYGATTFGISSVSKFIEANPDAIDLQNKCRNVTSYIIDCTESRKK